MTALPKVLGVVLAGGRATRFGSDKTLARLAGRPLIAHVARRARPQVDRLILNLNDNSPAVIEALGPLAEAPIVRDLDGRARGPLAGLLAAMDWVKRCAPEFEWLASFPADSPLFPEDLVRKMGEVAAGETRPVIATSGGRAHPTFGLWPVSVQPRLYQFVMEWGKGGAMEFARLCQAKEIDYPILPFDPFLNINRPEDLVIAAAHLGEATVIDDASRVD